MLRDSAGFLIGYVSLTDRIQQGRLTMVNVTHNRDDRSSRFQIFFFIFKGFDSFFFGFFLDLADGNLQAHFLGQQHDSIFVQILVYIGHNAHLHQCHDDLGYGRLGLFCKACYRDRYVDHDSSSRQFYCFHLRFRCSLRFVVFLVSHLFFQGLRSAALASATFQLGELIVLLLLAFLLSSVRSRLGYCYIAGCIVSSRSRSAAAILT